MAIPHEATWAVNRHGFARAVGDVEPFAVVAAVSNDVAWALANTCVFSGRGSLGKIDFYLFKLRVELFICSFESVAEASQQGQRLYKGFHLLLLINRFDLLKYCFSSRKKKN